MQLSKNPKRVSQFFSAFPKSTQNFESLGKKDEPKRLLVSEIVGCKKLGSLNG